MHSRKFAVGGCSLANSASTAAFETTRDEREFISSEAHLCVLSHATEAQSLAL